jgi:hypothetical protein
MNANGWDARRTAEEFDLSQEAVLEAINYSQRNEDLIREENAEENLRIDSHAYRH